MSMSGCRNDPAFHQQHHEIILIHIGDLGAVFIKVIFPCNNGFIAVHSDNLQSRFITAFIIPHLFRGVQKSRHLKQPETTLQNEDRKSVSPLWVHAFPSFSRFMNDMSSNRSASGISFKPSMIFCARMGLVSPSSKNILGVTPR